jgi:hypothetical protein
MTIKLVHQKATAINYLILPYYHLVGGRELRLVFFWSFFENVLYLKVNFDSY